MRDRLTTVAPYDGVIAAGVRPGFLSAVAELMRDTIAARRGGAGALARLHGRTIRYVHGRFMLDMALLEAEPAELDGLPAGAAGQAPVHAVFEARSRATGERYRFELDYPTTGPLTGVPLVIRYQPRWWLQVELTLEPDAPRVANLQRTGSLTAAPGARSGRRAGPGESTGQSSPDRRRSDPRCRIDATQAQQPQRAARSRTLSRCSTGIAAFGHPRHEAPIGRRVERPGGNPAARDLQDRRRSAETRLGPANVDERRNRPPVATLVEHGEPALDRLVEDRRAREAPRPGGAPSAGQSPAPGAARRRPDRARGRPILRRRSPH